MPLSLPLILPSTGSCALSDLQANQLVFDRIFQLPGGHTKFTIRRDPATGVYLTLSNINTNIS